MSNLTTLSNLEPSWLFKDIDRGFLSRCKQLVDDNKDPSHSWDHVIDVARTAKIISENEDVPYMPLALAAIAHDTFSGIDRAQHHKLAGEFVRRELVRTPHVFWTEEVALCCEQHRASYKGQYTTIVQEAFASADRGLLTETSICDIVTRSYKYSVSTGVDHESALKMVVKHMPEKFGHNGYAKWPDLYIRNFKHELEIVQTAMDNMTIEAVRKILEL